MLRFPNLTPEAKRLNAESPGLIQAKRLTVEVAEPHA